jgi:hypothetical protein
MDPSILETYPLHKRYKCRLPLTLLKGIRRDMIESAIVLSSGGPGPSVTLKAVGRGSLARTDVSHTFSRVVTEWLTEHGVADSGAPTRLSDIKRPVELIGTPEELAASLIRAGEQADLELVPYQEDDTILIVALIRCRPNPRSLQ